MWLHSASISSWRGCSLGGEIPLGIIVTGAKSRPNAAIPRASSCEVTWIAAALAKFFRSISIIHKRLAIADFPAISSGISMPRGAITTATLAFRAILPNFWPGQRKVPFKCTISNLVISALARDAIEGERYKRRGLLIGKYLTLTPSTVTGVSIGTSSSRAPSTLVVYTSTV